MEVIGDYRLNKHFLGKIYFLPRLLVMESALSLCGSTVADAPTKGVWRRTGWWEKKLTWH